MVQCDGGIWKALLLLFSVSLLGYINNRKVQRNKTNIEPDCGF